MDHLLPYIIFQESNEEYTLYRKVTPGEFSSYYVKFEFDNFTDDEIKGITKYLPFSTAQDPWRIKQMPRLKYADSLKKFPLSSIVKLEDEWFLVTILNSFFICDTYEGVINLLSTHELTKI